MLNLTSQLGWQQTGAQDSDLILVMSSWAWDHRKCFKKNMVNLYPLHIDFMSLKYHHTCHQVWLLPKWCCYPMTKKGLCFPLPPLCKMAKKKPNNKTTEIKRGEWEVNNYFCAKSIPMAFFPPQLILFPTLFTKDSIVSWLLYPGLTFSQEATVEPVVSSWYPFWLGLYIILLVKYFYYLPSVKLIDWQILNTSIHVNTEYELQNFSKCLLWKWC